MRIAFVDLVFSWPPHGGADVDLYHTIQGIQALGHDVHLFVSSCPESWERGVFEADSMPFPATKLEYSEAAISGALVASDFRENVDAWKPDVVFVCDGFFFKPAVILALAHYPTIARFYAYEAVCIRDFLLFKDGATCPCNYLETPNVCRKCAVTGMKSNILTGRHLTWSLEFMRARAYQPAYYDELTRALESLSGAIVYNGRMRRQIERFCPNVHVIPGGVQIDELELTGPPANDKTIVLAAGRMQDPMKGLEYLRDEVRTISNERSDFVVWATHDDQSLNNDWFKAIGWQDHAGMRALYQQSDVCVVPSIWEEPFGLVAVEAMASGRPVIVTKVGGLQDIVEHERSGFVVDPTKRGELASALCRLLDEPKLRREMGKASRKRVEEHYDWPRIIERYYPPLLEGVVT